jgi:polysaccharide biosynthesis protein PslG
VNRRGLILGAAGAAAAVIAAIAVLISSGGTRSEVATRSSTSSTTSSTASSVSATTTSSATSPAPPVANNPRARAAPGTEQFGANVNYLFNGQDFSPGDVARQLAALQRTGVTVARTDAFWEASEPAAPMNGVHDYQWGFDDAIALALAHHGLRWLPILDYTAPWAESIPGQDHSAPRSAAAYAAYAGAFAARYGPGGAFWRAHPGLGAPPVQTYEIWNEPDNGQFWAPAPDARRYGVLYEKARDAIAGADPRARVIVGGLMNPTHFLPELLSADPALRGHIDGVAIHPYGTPLVALSRIRGARATLTSLGLGSVPLYVTEFGWTTSPPGAIDYAPAAARPGYLLSTLGALGHLDCGVAAALLYTWVTPRRNAANSQNWYGISDPGRAGGADVAAFDAGLHAAQMPRPTIRLCRS